MDSSRLIFDAAASPRPGHVLILGGSGDSIFRGARSMLSMEDGMNKRQPFFTSPEELLEEEYYDEQLPEKKRRLTPEQVHVLERSFEAENKLEPERKGELAMKLGLQQRQVAVWFQNRRARWKTKRLERDYDRLKAAYDSLLADHDSLLKDNDHLRSQVATLSEKLRFNEIATEDPVGDPAAHVVSANPTGNASKLDQWSTGSTVADCEGLQLVDSCGSESYFHDGFGIDMGPVVDGGGGGARSEEDDIGSDDGCNYLPAGGGLLFGDHGNHRERAADNNWWGVWR